MDKPNPSYEWITLRASNVAYVAGMTGYTKAYLNLLLDKAKRSGRLEVKIPLATNVFTREER